MLNCRHLITVVINRSKMAVTKDKARVVTYIHKSLKSQAEKAAKQEGRSISNYIEQLIKQDVEKKQIKFTSYRNGD